MPLNLIDETHYKEFQALLEEFCGIVLGPNKQYLVSSRLNKISKEHNFETLGDLVERLRWPGSIELRTRVVDLMTTNETSWFRDEYPFHVLKDMLFPEFEEAGMRNLKIWSSACSTGQEPYSISMCVSEYQNRPGARLEASVLATDISPTVLAQAQKGQYQTSQVARGMSDERKSRFMKHIGEDLWEITPDIKRRVSFRSQNLQEPYSLLGQFDLIFCRNVLIYFSSTLRQDIVGRMAKLMKPGGYLILGSSESLGVHAKEFEVVRCSSGIVYRLKKPG